MLSTYFGPEIDVGTVMTSRIMKGNEEVVQYSTYRGLKEDEWSNQANRLSRK